VFPKILKATLDKIKISQSDIIKSGFKATGIYLIYREKVLIKLPGDLDSSSASSIIPQVLHDLFKETRFGSNDGPAKKCKRKRFNIEPGRSVTEANMFHEAEDLGLDTELNNEEELNPNTELNPNETELNTISEKNYETEENDETEENSETAIININNLKVDDFVKVKFETIRSNFEEYMGQITEIEEENILCQFLRKSQSMRGCYSFPFIIDEAYVTLDQVVKKLKVLTERRGNFKFE